MSTVAMLVGGVLGVLLRTLVDGPRVPDRSPSSRWWSLAIGVLGAFVLGALTGAVIGVRAGPQTAVGVALSGTLLTYCLFSSAATDLAWHGVSRQTVVASVIHGLSALAAATVGVTLGVILTG